MFEVSLVYTLSSGQLGRHSRETLSPKKGKKEKGKEKTSLGSGMQSQFAFGCQWWSSKQFLGTVYQVSTSGEGKTLGPVSLLQRVI